MKVRAVIQMLRGDGWFLLTVRGSHRQFKHPSKPGRVTVPGKPGDDLAPGTFKSILQQAGMKKRTLCATPSLSKKPKIITRLCRHRRDSGRGRGIFARSDSLPSGRHAGGWFAHP